MDIKSIYIDDEEIGMGRIFSIVFFFIIVLTLMIALISSFIKVDFLNFYDISRINVYEENGELISNRYLKTIQDDYEKYDNTAYDYVREINNKNYKVEGKFKIKEIKENDKKYIIKTFPLSGTRINSKIESKYREVVIYVKKTKINSLGLENFKLEKEIYVSGELNNISDTHFVFNNIEKLEVE